MDMTERDWRSNKGGIEETGKFDSSTGFQILEFSCFKWLRKKNKIWSELL